MKKNTVKQTQYPIAETVRLTPYQIAMAYWENEKYMFPVSEWSEREPKLEEFKK